MSSAAEAAPYAAVLTLSLDPSGSWRPTNVRSPPLRSHCNTSTTMRVGRRQRDPLKLPALAAPSQEPHGQTSLARLRYAAQETKMSNDHFSDFACWVLFVEIVTLYWEWGLMYHSDLETRM